MRERNPQYDKFLMPSGYADLGWQLSNDHPAEITCRAAGHKIREFDNSMFKFRCTDVITICDECKYVHHTDMSD
jgi:hypothetical protein